MADAPDSARRIEELERRLATLERRINNEVSPTVEEHDDRLDSHDLLLNKWAAQMPLVVAEQHRLADALTVQGATLELVLRNTASIAAALGVSK